jgi:hypothetical protein
MGDRLKERADRRRDLKAEQHGGEENAKIIANAILEAGQYVGDMIAYVGEVLESRIPDLTQQRNNAAAQSREVAPQAPPSPSQGQTPEAYRAGAERPFGARIRSSGGDS